MKEAKRFGSVWRSPGSTGILICRRSVSMREEQLRVVFDSGASVTEQLARLGDAALGGGGSAALCAEGAKLGTSESGSMEELVGGDLWIRAVSSCVEELRERSVEGVSRHFLWRGRRPK